MQTQCALGATIVGAAQIIRIQHEIRLSFCMPQVKLHCVNIYLFIYSYLFITIPAASVGITAGGGERNKEPINKAGEAQLVPGTHSYSHIHTKTLSYFSERMEFENPSFDRIVATSDGSLFHWLMILGRNDILHGSAWQASLTLFSWSSH